MGGGRWHDHGAFVAARPQWLCWRYLPPWLMGDVELGFHRGRV